MQRFRHPLSVVLAMVALSHVGAAESATDYLVDGKFKERMEIQTLQGGAVGFTGEFYAIEPDGSWSTGSVSPRREGKREVASKGRLSNEQMLQLAKDFARYDLAALPTHGEPVVNPSVTVIIVGEKRTELQPGRGQTSVEEDRAIRGRYEGIVRAVAALCKDRKNE
jgi:hypothetical protein